MNSKRGISLSLILILFVFLGGFKVLGGVEKRYAVALKVLKILSSPSPGASVVYIAQPNEKLDVVKDLGMWLKVRSQNGAVGYVQSNLVRIEIEKIIQAPSSNPAPAPQAKPVSSSSGVQPVVSKRHHKIWPYLLGGAVVAGGAAYFLLSKGGGEGGGIQQEQRATLKISSSPAEGTVYVDGEEKEETPCTIEVSAGEHEIKVKRDLYGEWSKKMNLAAGQEYTIEAKLAPYKYEFDLCFGGYGKTNGKFDEPSDVTIDSEGKVYVADYVNARIEKFNASGGFMTSFSIPYHPYTLLYVKKNKTFYVGGDPLNWGAFSYIIAFSASFNVKWKKAIPYLIYGFDMDDDLNIYMPLPDANKLLKLDSHGNEIAEWNISGKPTWAAVGNNGNVYVTLRQSGKIVIYSSSGSKKGEFSKNVPFPFAIAADRMGHVYVGSPQGYGAWGTDKIYKFLPDGKFVLTFAGHGTGDGELNGTGGLAIDEDGNVYAVDWGNNRVCKWRLSTKTASQASALITSKRIHGFVHYGRKSVTHRHIGAVPKEKRLVRRIRK